jgi:hypothetical protein
LVKCIPSTPCFPVYCMGVLQWTLMLCLASAISLGFAQLLDVCCLDFA